MQIRIPFTNIEFSLNAVSEKRGSTYSSNSFFSQIIGEYRDKRIDANSMFAAYRNNSDIYGCIREWSQNVGKGGLCIENMVNDEEPVPKNVSDMIMSVLNYYCPFRQTKNNTVRDLGVVGNAYWEIIWNESRSQILAVSRLDPRTMKVVTDDVGTVLKYIQTNKQGKMVDFNENDIIHFKLDVDPDNEVFGFSPLETIIWESMTDEEAKKTNYYFFENRATPGAWFVLEPNLAEDAKKQAIEEIKARLSGSKNYNKGAVLEGVKEIKTFGLNQKDMEFLLGRRFITEKICAAYGVPKFRLGYTENTNYSNGKELTKEFYEGTIQPLEELFMDILNRQLIPLLGLEGKVELEFEALTFEEEVEIEKRALTELSMGAITLRQYKMKTGQEITQEDEKQPNFDSYVIHGGSAILLEDVGVNPIFDANNPDAVEKVVNAIDKVYNQQ